MQLEVQEVQREFLSSLVWLEVQAEELDMVAMVHHQVSILVLAMNHQHVHPKEMMAEVPKDQVPQGQVPLIVVEVEAEH